MAVLIFFFQAEDGIRDGHVTGVQTCALPISVTGFYDRMHIEASHAVARTIFIDTDAVRPSQFDLSDAEREQLYTKGRQAATDFLDGTDDQDAWDFDRYRERFRTGPSAR